MVGLRYVVAKGGRRERRQGWRRTTENSIRRVDAPLGAITIRDQVRIFTTCQISPPCPQRARNYILETDWKVVFVARYMRPGVLAHRRTVRPVVFALALPPILHEGLSVSQASPVSGSRPLVARPLSLCPALLPRSLERRNGIYVRSMPTFQRFIIGPIHSLIHRFDRGAPVVNGPYDIMYIACYSLSLLSVHRTRAA